MGALDWQPAAAAAGGGGGEAGTPAPDPAASPGLLLSIPSAVLHEVSTVGEHVLDAAGTGIRRRPHG